MANAGRKQQDVYSKKEKKKNKHWVLKETRVTENLQMKA